MPPERPSVGVGVGAEADFVAVDARRLSKPPARRARERRGFGGSDSQTPAMNKQAANAYTSQAGT